MDHIWDADGERCVRCGDKDWFAGKNCAHEVKASPIVRDHACREGDRAMLATDAGQELLRCAIKELETAVSRPPTPVGWSDTDWIKHLEERETHPLECVHINQGSMDAYADAYEEEYNDWKHECSKTSR